MTTRRYQQDDLNAIALSHSYPFQKKVLAYMLERGWRVNAMKEQWVRRQCGEKRVPVVTVSHADGGFAGIAPNGLVFRPVKGKTKVEWQWSKMADLADATVPAPHVALTAA